MSSMQASTSTSSAPSSSSTVDSASPTAEQKPQPPYPKPKGSRPNRNQHPSRKEFRQSACDPPSYYTEDGLRKVHPYTYRFTTFAKQRWLGRTAVEVFGTEFRDRSRAYYEYAFRTGQILINHRIVEPEYVIKNGDVITNSMHRHEPPVVGGPIKVIKRVDDGGEGEKGEGGWMVIEKPGSMPVHPTGRYNHNTLLSVLKWDGGEEKVYTSNRLDRLTSGVMVVARSNKKAQELSALFRSGRIRKEYLARVAGRFPEEEVVCEEPLLSIDNQIGVNIVHPLGRPSKTIFTRLSYHESTNTSLVHCRPITGRTHQIRVHLQFLGYPIANDPIYNDANAWGSTRGRGGVYKDPEMPDVPSSSSDPSSSSSPSDPVDPSSDTPAIDDTPTSITITTGEDGYESDDPSKEHRAGMAATVQFSGGLVKAIRALRKARDHEDDFARLRDRVEATRLLEKLDSGDREGARNAFGTGEGHGLAAKDGEEGDSKNVDEIVEAVDKIDLAPSASTSVVSSSIPTSSTLTASTSADTRLHTDVSSGDVGGLGHCSICGIPLLPDPRPDQLFIYLHAHSYKCEKLARPLTEEEKADVMKIKGPEISAYARDLMLGKKEPEEWEATGEMPWWAREDWDGSARPPG